MDINQDKCPKSVKYCNYPDCKAVSTQRCSRCKEVYYCSIGHQKENWKAHKIQCRSSDSIKEVKVEKTKEESSVNDKKDAGEEFFKEKNSDASEAGGKRQSRCMFCGEQLVLESEDDAVYHMRICSALQEQLASPDQFTIPTMLREENNIPVPKKT